MNAEELLYITGLMGSFALIGLNILSGSFDIWSFISGAALIICSTGIYGFIREGYDSAIE